MTQVGIIGAGITGLTTAYHLHKGGISVTVYESSSRPGGVIQSYRDGPWLAEGGPNTILETDPRIRTLIEQLGLSQRRQYSDPGASARFVVRGGRPVQLPSSGPRFFLSPLFSPRAKLSLLREPFVARRTSVEDESVGDFVRRRLGQEFLDYAIDPLVTGIYAGDPARLSVRHAFPRIHALEDRYGSLIRGQILGARERRKRGDVSKANAKKFSFDHGLQVLPDTLGELLAGMIRYQTHVRAIVFSGDDWMIEHEHEGGRFRDQHRIVVYCGTARGLAKLQIQKDAVPSVRQLDSIEYPPVTSVVLGFRKSEVEHPCHGFGMLIPHPEGFSILGTIFSSALFPGRAPADHTTLTTYVGGARRPELAGLEDGALLQRVLKDLQTLLGVRGQPLFQHVTRWPHAIPQYNVGYDEYKQAMDAIEASCPGFLVAGHFRDGVALSDCLLTGRRTADRIISHLKALPDASMLPLAPTP